MKRRVFLITGTSFLFMGFVILLNSFQGMTGFVVFDGADVSFGTYAGLWFVLGGILLLSTPKARRSLHPALTNKEYFEKRADEITSCRGDAWVYIGEADGILDELKRRGYEIEHGKNMIAIHLTGINVPRERHAKIQKKHGLEKHILITSDPYDLRVRQVGIREKDNRIERVYSEYYAPEEHSLETGTNYTDTIEVVNTGKVKKSKSRTL